MHHLDEHSSYSLLPTSEIDRPERVLDSEADVIAGEKTSKTSGLSASSELQASTASITLQPVPVDLATLPVFEEYH